MKRKERSENIDNEEENPLNEPDKKKVKVDPTTNKPYGNEGSLKPPTTTKNKPPKSWTTDEISKLIADGNPPKLEFIKREKAVEILINGEIFYLKIGSPENPLVTYYGWSDRFWQDKKKVDYGIRGWLVSINEQFNPKELKVLKWIDNELAKWAFKTVQTDDPIVTGVESASKKNFEFFKVGHIRKTTKEKTYKDPVTKNEKTVFNLAPKIFTSTTAVNYIGDFLYPQTKVFIFKENSKSINDCEKGNILDYKGLVNNKSSDGSFNGVYNVLQTRIAYATSYKKEIGISLVATAIVVIPNETRQKLQQIRFDEENKNKEIIEEPVLTF